MMDYADEQLKAIYELGRLYFEMGYFAPAERIFAGLSVVDGAQTPARLGLGLVKLERGLFQEAAVHFRNVIQSGRYTLPAKVALASAFLAAGELNRAKSMLGEISKEAGPQLAQDTEMRILWEALVIRCSGAEQVA